MFSSVSQANDWPRWRGADFDDQSKETGLLKEWPAEGPKKVWMNEDAGLGYSGFAVVGDTLYTMGARDAAEFVIAIDVKTGKQKWAAEAGPLLTNNWGNGPRSTPTVDGDKVYAMSGKGHLSCLSAADGKVLWKVTMEELGGKVPGWGYTESVLVDGNLVVCTPGGAQGSLAAFDKTTGKKAWQNSEWKDPAQYSSIIPADHNGVRQLIQLTMQSVGAVNAADGKVLWTTPFPGKTAVIPSPIFNNGKVFVVAGYGVGCKMVNVGANNVVTDVYANTDLVNHHGGVLLYKGNLYGFSDGKGWTCMDFAAGTVKWQEKKALKKGAIHLADGMLYLLEEDSGTVVLIDASPEGWKEHGRFKLEPQTTQRSKSGKIWTHPVVSGGKLYLRDQELLFAFDVSAGAARVP
ncbi:MAG: bamB 1 [Verrucomicrobiaceae bacterium]|nr:bamB 1 [Verrucomicrobiaceae bacterium]